MHPHNTEYRVIFSSVVQSFGVTQFHAAEDLLDSDDPAAKPILTDLPFEVLRKIAHFLDPFRYSNCSYSGVISFIFYDVWNVSLCHISVTCHLLRDVARSLLYTQGLVTPHWQKSPRGWNITHHVIKI